MINKVHQVKAANPIVYPIIDEPIKKNINIVNTYTKSSEEDGEIRWYLYLVTDDEQVFKYRLDFYE